MAAETFAPDPALPNSGFPVSIAQYDDDTKRQIVRAFAAYEMSGVDTADRIILGVVPEQLATDVERIAQIDIHGFDNVLQADGLRHGAKHEGRTGNKPVTPEDVAALLDIFDTYNNITVTSKRGETSIKLSKTGADGMTYVAVIGKKKGHIFTKNMWKGQTKGDGSFRRTDAHNAPASTPAAAANYEPSTDSLPENVQDGKGTTGFLPSTADATGRPQAQAREPMRANRADAAATPQGTAGVDVMDELVRGAGAVGAQETDGAGARAQSAMEAALAGTEEPGARPAGQGKRRYRTGVNRVDTAGRLSASDRMQLRVLDGLGKKYGVKLVIEDTIRYEDGEGRVYAGTANAYYDRSDGTIHVALDAEGGAYLFFAVHELTHRLRAENADAYAALEAFVLNRLEASELYGALAQGEGGTLEERIASVRALYAARGQELSRGEAIEEIVCDAIPVILTDEQAVRELVRTDRTLAERIRDFFEEFYQELVRQLAGVVYGSGNRAEAAALMNDAETVRELAELFKTALESSADLQYELLTEAGSAIEEAGTAEHKRFSAKDDRAASIKEQIRAYAEKLNGMQAVAVIESGSRPKKNGHPDRLLERQELQRYYGNTTSSVDRQGFGRIEFDQNAIAQLVKYLNSDAEFAAAKAAPAVVKRGIEIDHHMEHKGRNDIESYTFAAPVVLNGKRGNEAVVVQRTNRNKPHAVRIVMPDGSGFDLDVNERNSPDTSERLPQRATVYGPEGTVSADSIHNSQEEVNSALPDLRFSQKADAEGGSAPGRIYDYSKPFAEQVDDWMAGRTPQYDTLLIGRTPLLYRQIGLSDVPMTIDQTHLDYMINGTKNADHHLGVALVRQLPELLEHPVAVIESATRPDDSVMAIVRGKVNGRQLVAAVRIGGNGRINYEIIDSNHIVSAQGRGNAITKLLNDALQKELRGEVGVYYWNKEEALPLTVQSGVQFPGGRINDGLIHSIFDAASPVNRNYLEQTETQQFKRWFGRSSVVQADGTPRAVRQGVDAAMEVLDGKTALQDGEAVYVKLENPYPAGTAAEVPGRAALEAGGYDGAVYQDGNGGTHYVVLDGTQLKSATDNAGTFDGRNPNLRFSQKADAEGGSAPGRIYDYSKPFAEQVDDWMAGQTPQYDTLLIGRTPLLYRQIGLSDVPMTIDQTHLDYMVNGTKNEDHHLGVALVKQLPELLEHPVAVIESATRPDDSVMAIVRGKVNGRQLVAAVRIGGNGVLNDLVIDANHIVSAQGRGNAVTRLLNNALQKELRGEVGVYYWNKEEALPLMAESGVQFPGFPINDGLIHSIFDAASPVNRKYMDQIHTLQFKRWFGRSGVVQADGTPRAVRQGVDATVEVLDGKTALQDGEAVYVKLENPYPVGTAAEVPDRAALEAGGYDGAVYQDGNGGTHYVVLDGTQLKSATDNAGTFDGRNPNLRFSQKADAGWAAYVSEEAQQRYAQDGRFQRWAHRDLAFISAASWDGVHIPADVLMQNPKIREAQELTEGRGSSLQKNLPGTNSLVDERRERLAQRLLNAEHGSAVFENGKIKKINGVEQFTGEVEQGRHACIVIGRPAGGKSRVFANPLSNRYKARILDADTVKPWLDGFDDGYGAGYVQDESSLIMEMAFEKAIARGDNVIIPKIGGGRIVDLANRMKSAGYTVDLYYNEVSEETSIMRAASRFAEEGRYLSLNYLLTIRNKPKETFTKWAESGIFNYAEWRNNDVGFGEEPRLVWRTGDGGLASVLGDAAELERTVGRNQGDAQRY